MAHHRVASALAFVLFAVAGCAAPQPPMRTVATLGGHQAPLSQSWSFDADPRGPAPQGSTVFSGAWTVRAEADAPSPPNAVCQTATATFPALLLSQTQFRDVDLSTRFKPISGSGDRAAGLIFRVQDGQNYDILRANALEGTLQFFRYVHGDRQELNYSPAQVATGTWQSLRVATSGSTFRGYLDDRLVVQDSDRTFQSGGIGLWTKADSMTCFDDVRLNAS